MEVQPTIVRLSPNQTVRSVSFDEAFGESYSEARGKRQAKKAAKQAARSTRKSAKQTAKVQRKVAKQAGKAEVRTARKQARIAPRAAAQAMRQENKTNKLVMRQDRRALRRGPDPVVEEQFEEELPTTELEQGSGDVEYTNEPNEGRPNRNASQQQEEESFEEPAGEQEYYEQNAEEGPVQEEEEAAEEEFYGEEENPDGYGFDGVANDDSQKSDFADSEAELIGVPPAVVNCATKIEWNKEFISRLKEQKAKLAAKDENTDDVDTKINRCFNRISDLEMKLKKYANYDGEFSSASGDDFIEMRGKRQRNASTAQKLGRVAQISKAKRAAAGKRAAIRGGGMRSGGQAGPTPVDASLQPEFSEQKIVIPAEEKESATGPELNAFRNLGDYNETQPTKVEIGSDFSGKYISDGLKKNWKGLAIGLAVAGIAIWAINKYKVVDKILK